jgi:hypothetical protein
MSDSAPRPTPLAPVGGSALARALRVFTTAFLILVAVGTSWTFGSPVMAVPDEPAHAIHAAAVVRGQWSGEQTDQGGWTNVEVPEYVAESYGVRCYAFDAAVSVECQGEIPSGDDPTVITTSAGSYNPFYYVFVGLPTLVLDGAPAFYAMRLVGVLLSAAFLALAVVALSQLRRRTFSTIAFVAATTPMVCFLMAGINPNSLEIAASVMLFCWLRLLVERIDEGVPAHRVAMVAVAAVAVANTRSIGLLWLLVVVVATLADVHVLRVLVRSRAFWVGTVAIGLGVGFSLLWLLSSQSLDVTVPNPGAGTSFPAAFHIMVSATYDNFQGYVGLFGWLDTPVPQTVVFLWSSVLFIAAIAALFLGRGSSRRAFVVVLAAFLLVPPLVQGSTAYDYGFIWQARYVLALFCVAVIAAGVCLDVAFPGGLRDAPARRLAVAVLGLFAVLSVYSFLWNLRRYVVGTPDSWRKMLVAPEWQPPGTWALWAVVLTIAVAAGVEAVRRGVVRPSDVPGLADAASARPARLPVS